MRATLVQLRQQWRREGFCRPEQSSLVPPLQPATPKAYINDTVTEVHDATTLTSYDV